MKQIGTERVYVVQETNYNFSKAEEFGQIKFLSVYKNDDFHNITNSQHNDRMLSHLRHELRQFDQDSDYIIITGSPYITAAVFWILGRMGMDRLNILRWDNRDFVYIPLTLKI